MRSVYCCARRVTVQVARGCARIDSRLDTAKICSDGRVDVDHAHLLQFLGDEKRFHTAWVVSGSDLPRQYTTKKVLRGAGSGCGLSGKVPGISRIEWSRRPRRGGSFAILGSVLYCHKTDMSENCGEYS